MPTLLAPWIDAWTTLYSNSAALRTSVAFAHIAGLVVGGGSAIVADRATLAAWRRDAGARLAQVRVLHATHRGVLVGLGVVTVSGVLLFAADVDTYLDSSVFWVKMGLIALLVANGGVLVAAGRRAQAGQQRAWATLRYGSIASIALWSVTTLLERPFPMSECDGGRRTLLQAGGCVALTLALGGMLPGDLWALPVGVVTGESSGTERRYPIPAADGVSIDRDEQVIVVRSQHHAFVFALSCPHQNAALRWLAKDQRFECTKHHSKYQPDGVYTSGRATRNMDRFAIRRDPTSLIIDLDRVFKSDVDAAGWAAAVVDV